METTETVNANPKLNYTEIKAAALTLRALNNKVREKILNLIIENKQMIVTEIYVKLRIEQSVASQHLAILRKDRIVLVERDGKNMIYSINQRRIAEIDKFVKDMMAV
jgi:DNA-binding transcriptional ArsR family regulator